MQMHTGRYRKMYVKPKNVRMDITWYCNIRYTKFMNGKPFIKYFITIHFSIFYKAYRLFVF